MPNDSPEVPVDVVADELNVDAIEVVDRLSSLVSYTVVPNFRVVGPKLGERVYIAEGAQIVGDVEIGDHSSVWYNCIVRGDVDVRVAALAERVRERLDVLQDVLELRLREAGREDLERRCRSVHRLVLRALAEGVGEAERDECPEEQDHPAPPIDAFAAAGELDVPSLVDVQRGRGHGAVLPRPLAE